MCGQLCRWLPLHQRTLWSKSPWKILISLDSVDQSSVHFLSPLTDFAIDTRTPPTTSIEALNFLCALFVYKFHSIISPKHINYYHNFVVSPVALFIKRKLGKFIQFLPYSAELFFKCIIKSCWKIEAMEKPREFFIMPKWDFFLLSRAVDVVWGCCCWCAAAIAGRRRHSRFAFHGNMFIHSWGECYNGKTV